MKDRFTFEEHFINTLSGTGPELHFLLAYSSDVILVQGSNLVRLTAAHRRKLCGAKSTYTRSTSASSTVPVGRQQKMLEG